MNRFFYVASALLLLMACVKDDVGQITPPAEFGHKIRNYREDATRGQLMVRLSAEAGPLTSISLMGHDIELMPMFGRWDTSELGRWVVARFDTSLDLTKVAEELAADSRVEIVEYSYTIYNVKPMRLDRPVNRPEPTRSVEYPFDDPELPWQWHYYNDGSLSDDATAGADINLLEAWKYTAGDPRIIVAVVDGGIMSDHPDLAANMWVNTAEAEGSPGIDDDMNGYVDDIHGYNFVTMQGTINPDMHGTHVAGTIAAVNNNGYAVSGIAGGTGNDDGVKLMSCQIFDGEDGCQPWQIAAAFKYAADNGAVILNNSWGYADGAYGSDATFGEFHSVLKDAMLYFTENAGLEGLIDGGVAIFAAGNGTYPMPNYPGAYYDYICVTAMAANYNATYYTNYGDGANICAPGGDTIYGTIMGISSTSTDLTYGYEYQQGTSMATPHVSGAAALGLSYALERGYSFTAREFRDLIVTSVHDINPYQTGTRRAYDYKTGTFYDLDLTPYYGNLGGGYLDAHLLLMQIEGTPCVYFTTGEEALLSLDEYFGDGVEHLTIKRITLTDEVRTALGITTDPTIENGELKIRCSKPGSGRITISAIVGGDIVGGSLMGGMEVSREIEMVVRQAKASNGGWF